MKWPFFEAFLLEWQTNALDLSSRDRLRRSSVLAYISRLVFLVFLGWLVFSIECIFFSVFILFFFFLLVGCDLTVLIFFGLILFCFFGVLAGSIFSALRLHRRGVQTQLLYLGFGFFGGLFC